MKRILAAFLLSAIFITLFCSCTSHKDTAPSESILLPDDTPMTEEAVSNKTEKSDSLTDPICDISLFDDDSAKIEEKLGIPDYRDAEDESCIELRYYDYSYMGRNVDLDLEIDNTDPMDSALILTYYYNKDYEPNDPDEVYQPTTAELKAAQEFKDAIIALLTERYGEPVWRSDDGVELGWAKEQRMDYVEGIKLERGYSERAFDLYCWING